MFGRSNWAVIGIDPESLDEFQEGLRTDLLILRASQLVALASARLHGGVSTTAGINPYGSPRLDEEFEKSLPFSNFAFVLKSRTTIRRS